ncbi:MAG TPA: M20/M25/M40 family metallo-hydrolase, partial [Candidatus Hodarchaeales archaeon]|nr:M20/M25/M40 family metallo-hydrolase [Candidatus Hodarchaeales archaeon]
MSDTIIEFLKSLIEFPSVSSDNSKRQICLETANFLIKSLKSLGAETKLVENESKGKNPIILAKLLKDPSKPTLLCYSHYDVQPALKEDGWATDPFVPTIQTDKDYIYGRGVSDDKGPIASTFFATKELIDEGFSFNLAFLFEGEEESSSGGFEETVTKHRDFYDKINGILVLDTSWLGEKRPSMDYGFRGIAYMGIEISGPTTDKHSGFGGTIREPMTDLISIMSKLVTPEGKVLINGF